MRKIFAWTVTLVFLVIIFYRINLQELLSVFHDFNLKNTFLIAPLYIFTLYLRGIRWKTLLLDDQKYSSLHLGEVFTAGSMLNIFLPARAGDVYRAYYLGAVKSEKKMKIFGSVILERILDGICIFFILLIAVLLFFKKQWIINLTCGTGVLFIGSLFIFYLIFKFNKTDLICDKLTEITGKIQICGAKYLAAGVKKTGGFIKSFMEGFKVFDNIKCLKSAFLLSIVIWWIESYIAYLIIAGFNLGIGFAAGLFVISLTSFSTMLPSTSIFLGPYQYAYILALGIFNIPKSAALAVSVVHQAILMIILTVLGGFYLMKFNITSKDLKSLGD